MSKKTQTGIYVTPNKNRPNSNRTAGQQRIDISGAEFISIVAKNIVYLHPYNNPPKLDVILQDLHNRIHGDKEWVLMDFENFDELEKYIKDFLLSKKEFCDYNISKKLWDEGVRDCEDPRNAGMMFSDRYSGPTKEENFIDLDACIRNIAMDVKRTVENSRDCFLCKYSVKYGSTEPSASDRCKKCKCNPKYRCNFEWHENALKPRENHDGGLDSNDNKMD